MGAPNYDQVPEMVQMHVQNVVKNLAQAPPDVSKAVVEHLETNTSYETNFLYDLGELFMQYPMWTSALILSALAGQVYLNRKKILELLK